MRSVTRVMKDWNIVECIGLQWEFRWCIMSCYANNITAVCISSLASLFYSQLIIFMRQQLLISFIHSVVFCAVPCNCLINAVLVMVSRRALLFAWCSQLAGVTTGERCRAAPSVTRWAETVSASVSSPDAAVTSVWWDGHFSAVSVSSSVQQSTFVCVTSFF